MTKAKKILALVMAVVMCLSVMVGTLSVSAATPGTITVGTTTVDEGAASATVTVNIAGAAFSAGEIKMTYDSKLPVPTVASALQITADTETAGKVNVVIESGASTAGNVESGSFTLTFAGIEALTAGDYAITVDSSEFGDYNENDVLFNAVAGKIAVVAKPSCTHANLTVVSATPAVNGGDDGNIQFTCDDCGEPVNKTVEYVTASSLTSAPDIGCDSTTLLTIKANASNYNTNATDGFVVITHHYTDGTADTTEIMTMADAGTKGNYITWILPIWYTRFSDTYDCTFYTLRNGQWSSGLTRTYSIKSAAMAVISGTGAEGLKKAAANLLEAGAQAQSFFKKGADNLANSELVGDYAKYVDKTVTTPVKNPGVNYDIRPSDYQTAGKAIFATPSALLMDAVAIEQKVNFNFYSGDKNQLDDLHIRYSYAGHKGGTVSGECTEYTMSNNAIFAIGVTAPNMRQVITFTVYNGDTPISAPAIYSVEGVMAQALSVNSAYAPLISAILNYSDAVAEYF